MLEKDGVHYAFITAAAWHCYLGIALTSCTFTVRVPHVPVLHCVFVCMLQDCSRLGMRLFQTALVLIVQQELLPGLTSPPMVFDPEFDQFDCQVLESLGMKVSSTADGCRHGRVSSPTLVYMPCCPRDLYDDILVCLTHRLTCFALPTFSSCCLHSDYWLWVLMVALLAVCFSYSS